MHWVSKKSVQLAGLIGEFQVDRPPGPGDAAKARPKAASASRAAACSRHFAGAVPPALRRVHSSRS